MNFYAIAIHLQKEIVELEWSSVDWIMIGLAGNIVIISSTVAVSRNKLHAFQCMYTQLFTGPLSLTAHISLTCKSLKPDYPWQAVEFLIGQASSSYSCVIPVTSGSYCCDNTVILVEGNQRDLTDTQIKLFLSAGAVKLICENQRSIFRWL